MLKELWNYLKHPCYKEDENLDFAYRVKIFTRLLFLNVAFSFTLGMFIAFCTTLFNIDTGNHAMESLFKTYAPWKIFFLAAIAAPIIEELFFRGPLFFFKKSRYFNYAFYCSILFFGGVHITNFEDVGNNILLAILLTSPQLAAGVFFGYIRVRFGLKWSMFLHAAHNAVLIGPMLLLSTLDIPIQ